MKGSVINRYVKQKTLFNRILTLPIEIKIKKILVTKLDKAQENFLMF